MHIAISRGVYLGKTVVTADCTRKTSQSKLISSGGFPLNGISAQ